MARPRPGHLLALLSLLGCLVCLGLPPAPLAAVSAAAASPPAAPAGIQVLVQTLEPRAPRSTDQLHLAGTLTNTGTTAVTGLQVQLRRGFRMDNRTQLDAAAPASTTTPFWAGAPQPATPTALAPGERASFDLRLRVADLGLGQIGVYPLRVEVLGRTSAYAAREVRGSVLTFLPWFPDGTPPCRTRIAWLWPLVDQPRRAADRVLVDNGLAASLAPSGRLGQLVAGAAAGQQGACDPAQPACRPTAVPVTYAVDPDLLRTAGAMTTPYPVRSGTATTTVTDTAPARAWLSAVKAATAGHDVLALPYADPDVVALTGPDAGLSNDVTQLRQLGAREAAQALGRTPLSSVVWPPSGRLTRGALESLTTTGVTSTTAAVLDPVALAGNLSPNGLTPSAHAGRLLTQTGLPVEALVRDTVLSRLLAAPTAGIGARLVEQRWLVETAMIAAEAPSVSRTLVVAPPRRGRVDAGVGAAALQDTGRLPWLCPVALSAVAAGPAPCPGEAPPSPPTSTPTLELALPQPGDPALAPGYLGAVRAARSASVQFTDEVLDPTSAATVSTAAQLLRARARVESSAWRTDAPAGRALLGDLQGTLSYLRGRVALAVGRGTVTLTSSSGVIAVNVVNQLAQPVRVGVSLRANNDARLSTLETPVVSVAPHSSVQVNVRVATRTSGHFAVQAELVDRRGRPFGTPVELIVRSTQYGRVALAVTGLAAGVLLAAAGVRITRRALQRPAAR